MHNRKRAANDTESNSAKKAKLNRLNALIDDEPLPPTLPETNDADILLGSASNISEMVASMKKQIEQRKKMLSKIFLCERLRYFTNFE